MVCSRSVPRLRPLESRSRCFRKDKKIRLGRQAVECRCVPAKLRSTGRIRVPRPESSRALGMHFISAIVREAVVNLGALPIREIGGI
jgi:hypothetical protein